MKCLLTAYFIGNISAKKYQNVFTCVKVIAKQRWDVFETPCIYQMFDFRKSDNIRRCIGQRSSLYC